MVAPRIISMLTGPNQPSLSTKRRSPNWLVREVSSVTLAGAGACSGAAPCGDGSEVGASRLIVELLGLGRTPKKLPHGYVLSRAGRPGDDGGDRGSRRGSDVGAGNRE